MTDLNKIIFIDAEVAANGAAVTDVGALKGTGGEFHCASLAAFTDFLRGGEYICGHNILKHDFVYLKNEISAGGAKFFIDTLYLSPLLFPKKPYHKLLKDDKLSAGELNNPLNDAKKARDLFYDEIDAFNGLDEKTQSVYFELLGKTLEFRDFFKFIGRTGGACDAAALIRETFAGKICASSPIEKLIAKYPIELAYALALIGVTRV